MSDTATTAPVEVLLPVVLAGRRSTETRWYRSVCQKPLELTAADFVPLAAVRECTTEMPWGTTVSRKRWDFDVEKLSLKERVVICRPFRIAQSKSEQLLDALQALGWERCEVALPVETEKP